MQTFKIPTHLRALTRKWVRSVIDDFDFESHHFRILIRVAEAWDRGEQAREQIDRDGITVPDRYGVLKQHPAIAVERDSRTAFFRGIRELALDGVGSPEAPRMPRTADYGARR